MRRGAAAWVVLLGCAGAVIPAAAAPPTPGRAAPPARGLRVTAMIRPAQVGLGQPALYEGVVILRPGMAVRWSLPRSDSVWTWGEPRAWRRSGEAGNAGRGMAVAETAHVAIPIQAFTTGVLPVPGLAFRILDPHGAAPRVGVLPLLRLTVLPSAASDTSARLRPLRGPLAAPWWERVPWRWVAAGLAALALAALLWRLARRRAARSAALPGAAPALDPVQRALAELEALRGLGLPPQGRFGEHAFHLTRIARGFLEAVSGAARPGDTTPELIARLAAADLAAADQESLATLLRGWDLLKFARAGSSVSEAQAAEAALEALVRRWDEARRAAAARVA